MSEYLDTMDEDFSEVISSFETRLGHCSYWEEQPHN